MTTEAKGKAPAKGKQPHLLFGWDPTELSFVSKAGNRRKFITHRHADGAAMPYHPTAEAKVIERMRAMDPGVAKHIALNVGKRRTERDAEGTGNQAPMPEEAMAALKGAARTLVSYKGDLTIDDLVNMGREIGISDDGGDDDQADEEAAAEDDSTGDQIESVGVETGASVEDNAPDTNPEATTLAAPVTMGANMQKPEGVSDADHKAALDAANAAYAAAVKAKGSKQTRSAEPPPAATSEAAPAAADGVAAAGESAPAQGSSLAGLTAEQKAEIQAMLAEATKDLKLRSADVEKNLAAEREQRLANEYAKKAEQYAVLGIGTDKISAVLRSAHGNPEQLATLEAAFSAASEQLGQANRRGGDLYGEIGSRQAAPAAGSAEAKLEGLVNSMTERAASSGKTKEQMYRDALRSPEGRAMYAQLSAR